MSMDGLSPLPTACSLCNGENCVVIWVNPWDGKYTKKLGWRCSAGGLRHFQEAKPERLIRMQQHSQALRRQQTAVSEHESAVGS
jgi:hypothetical protein